MAIWIRSFISNVPRCIDSNIFILNWSDYLIALLLTRKDWTTIPVYMNALATAASGQLYGAKAALGLLAAVPPIILGISIQRFLVRGLTFGALKQ